MTNMEKTKFENEIKKSIKLDCLMGNKFEIFKRVIISHSISNDYDEACSEWYCNEYEETRGIGFKCICTQEIKRLYYITHSFIPDKENLLVGHDCVKKINNAQLRKDAKRKMKEYKNQICECGDYKVDYNKFCKQCTTSNNAIHKVCKCGKRKNIKELICKNCVEITCKCGKQKNVDVKICTTCQYIIDAPKRICSCGKSKSECHDICTDCKYIVDAPHKICSCGQEKKVTDCDCYDCNKYITFGKNKGNTFKSLFYEDNKFTRWYISFIIREKINHCGIRDYVKHNIKYNTRLLRSQGHTNIDYFGFK
jgi:hypothetical protein